MKQPAGAQLVVRETSDPIGLGAYEHVDDVAHAVALVHTGDAPLLGRAAGNLKDVKVTQPGGISLYDLFAFRHLLLTREALDKVVEVWGK